jgi:hypothetical protein
VAPVLGDVERHHDEVGDPHRDLLMTAGAQVGLARLERVDERDLEVVVLYARVAHKTRRTHTTTAAITSA